MKQPPSSEEDTQGMGHHAKRAKICKESSGAEGRATQCTDGPHRSGGWRTVNGWGQGKGVARDKALTLCGPVRLNTGGGTGCAGRATGARKAGPANSHLGHRGLPVPGAGSVVPPVSSEDASASDGRSQRIKDTHCQPTKCFFILLVTGRHGERLSTEATRSDVHISNVTNRSGDSRLEAMRRRRVPEPQV